MTGLLATVCHAPQQWYAHLDRFYPRKPPACSVQSTPTVAMTETPFLSVFPVLWVMLPKELVALQHRSVFVIIQQSLFTSCSHSEKSVIHRQLGISMFSVRTILTSLPNNPSSCRMPFIFVVPTSCPPGHFIDGTTSCIECPDSTYQPRASQVPHRSF